MGKSEKQFDKAVVERDEEEKKLKHQDSHTIEEHEKKIKNKSDKKVHSKKPEEMVTVFGVYDKLFYFICCNLALLSVTLNYLDFISEGSIKLKSVPVSVLFMVVICTMSWYLWKNIRTLSNFSMLIGLQFIGLALFGVTLGIHTGFALFLGVFFSVPYWCWCRFRGKLKFLSTTLLISINFIVYFLVQFVFHFIGEQVLEMIILS